MSYLFECIMRDEMRRHYLRRMIIMEENLNMSMRKFLKKVGVTSQQAIEKAIRESNLPMNDLFSLEVKTVLSIPSLNLEHEVKGEIGTK